MLASLLMMYFLMFSRFKEGSLLQELTEIYSKYWSGKWSSIVPRKFKKQVELLHSQFVGGGQVNCVFACLFVHLN